MRFAFLSLLLILATTSLFAQDSTDSTVFTVVEKMPEFPGGERAMMEFVMSKIVYPARDLENNVEGMSIVQFIVEADGSITNIQIAPSAESRGTQAMHEESIRVVGMMPKWKPGYENGKAVRVKYVLPIRYKLKGKQRKKK